MRFELTLVSSITSVVVAVATPRLGEESVEDRGSDAFYFEFVGLDDVTEEASANFC